jgi:hypothetical protein
MLSTDIAPVFYRSNRGNFLATRTKDIPEREQALGTKKQPGQMRPPKGAKVLPCEFRSGVVATWRFWTECNSGACSLSRIGTKRDRAASEKTCRGKILFPAFSVFDDAALERLREAGEVRCLLSGLKRGSHKCPRMQPSMQGRARVHRRRVRLHFRFWKERASRDTVARRFENKRREFGNIDT